MRKNGRQITEDLRKRFVDLTGDRDAAEMIFPVELLLWGFYQVHSEGKAQEAWSLIPGYDEPILPGTHRELIARLRVLFPTFRNRQAWHDLIQEYQEIDLKYRLFAITPEGYLQKNTPDFIPDRETVYRQILDKPIPFHAVENTFAKPGLFVYQRSIDGQVQEFRGELFSLPKVEGRVRRLPLYRSKKRVGGSFPADWIDMSEEMDEILGGSRFRDFVRQSQFIPLGDKPFQYAGNLHIAGGLGVGKSTFILLETYRLVKKHQVKVGIIEGSVEGVLEKVRELRKLGLKAVPIIGRSNRTGHLAEFLYSVSKKAEDLTSLREEAADELRYLSGKCVIHALAEDFAGDQHYPCAALQQEKQKRLLCPLYAQCGVIRPELELVDADVWVATAPSVLKSRFSPMVDPYRRTYYEAMYQYLDVIFVDEADQVQMAFDQAFIGQYDLIGKSDDLFGRLVRSTAPRVASDPGLYSHTLVSNWLSHFDYLRNIVNKMYHLLSRSPSLASWLKNRIFHVYRILHDVAKHLWGENYQEQAGYKMLSDYAKEPLNHLVLSPIVDQLLNPIDQQRKKNLLAQCLKAIANEEKRYEDEPKLFQKLEFFLYLARIDEHLRYLTTNHLYVNPYLNLEEEIGQMFRTTPRDYHPFIKDSMTGLLLGYRYLATDGVREGHFKLLEYNGVGRELLKDWHRIYEDADQWEGPAVVFLSGSSYAPGSHHFHLDIPVHWLLISQREKPWIDQRLRLIPDLEANRYLYVSGTRHREERTLAIQKMVRDLKGTIASELAYWRDENRKILLVVNSYEDLEGVREVLQSDPDWKDCFRLLSRERVEEGHFIPKRFIRDFAQEEADVLAVPLTAVRRGYNILQPDTGRSLFGSVFFLVRPYHVPGDMAYIIPSLHGYLPSYLRTIGSKRLQYEDGIKHLRHKSIQFLEDMVRKPQFWALLDEDERRLLSWYTFILVWQMIGRLLRGGTNARVWYVDSKFAHPHGVHGTGVEDSMLASWKQMLQELAGDLIVQELYGPFMQSIDHLINSEREIADV